MLANQQNPISVKNNYTLSRMKRVPNTLNTLLLGLSVIVLVAGCQSDAAVRTQGELLSGIHEDQVLPTTVVTFQNGVPSAEKIQVGLSMLDQASKRVLENTTTPVDGISLDLLLTSAEMKLNGGTLLYPEKDRKQARRSPVECPTQEGSVSTGFKACGDLDCVTRTLEIAAEGGQPVRFNLYALGNDSWLICYYEFED